MLFRKFSITENIIFVACPNRLKKKKKKENNKQKHAYIGLRAYDLQANMADITFCAFTF